MTPQKVTKYQTSNGELFNTVEEANSKEKALKYEYIANSVYECLADDKPNNYEIIFGVIFTIKKTLGKLTKKDIDELLNYYKDKIPEDEY